MFSNISYLPSFLRLPLVSEAHRHWRSSSPPFYFLPSCVHRYHRHLSGRNPIPEVSLYIFPAPLSLSLSPHSLTLSLARYKQPTKSEWERVVSERASVCPCPCYTSVVHMFDSNRLKSPPQPTPMRRSWPPSFSTVGAELGAEKTWLSELSDWQVLCMNVKIKKREKKEGRGGRRGREGSMECV